MVACEWGVLDETWEWVAVLEGLKEPWVAPQLVTLVAAGRASGAGGTLVEITTTSLIPGPSG